MVLPTKLQPAIKKQNQLRHISYIKYRLVEEQDLAYPNERSEPVKNILTR